jgi:hypothetical protein
MIKLTDIYGQCIIPKNTLLFRGHNESTINDCMFFATKLYVASAFNRKKIQVWQTKKDIQILFLVDDINANSWTHSALPQVFNSLFPLESNPDFNDLDIKQKNINRRNKLTRKLFDEYNTLGWLTSLENRVELEICLFDKQANANHLKLIDIVDSKNKTYYKDSLDRIKIFPSSTFYKKINQTLLPKSSIHPKEKDHSKSYQEKMKIWIKIEMQNGKNRLEAKHDLFNLRAKLKL